MDQNSLKKSFPIYLKEDNSDEKKTLSQAIQEGDLDEEDEGMHYADDVEMPYEDNPEPEDQMHDAPQSTQDDPEELVDEVENVLAQVLGEDQLSDVDVEEGKMSDILGVPEDEDISDAYDGSPEDAAQEVVDAVGEDEAASMINYAANISGDQFLEDMQDALKDIEESFRRRQSLSADRVLDSVLADQVNELQKLDRLAQEVLNG